jgi:hypothetical protein
MVGIDHFNMKEHSGTNEMLLQKILFNLYKHKVEPRALVGLKAYTVYISPKYWHIFHYKTYFIESIHVYVSSHVTDKRITCISLGEYNRT